MPAQTNWYICIVLFVSTLDVCSVVTLTFHASPLSSFHPPPPQFPSCSPTPPHPKKNPHRYLWFVHIHWHRYEHTLTHTHTHTHMVLHTHTHTHTHTWEGERERERVIIVCSSPKYLHNFRYLHQCSPVYIYLKAHVMWGKVPTWVFWPSLGDWWIKDTDKSSAWGLELG